MNPLLVGYGSWGRKVAAKLEAMDIAPCCVIEPGNTAGQYDGYPGSQAFPIEHSIAAWAAAGGTATTAVVCTPPYHGRLRTVSQLVALGVDRIHLAKPACVDEEELDEMLLLTECGVEITVGHTTLYQPQAENLLKLVDVVSSSASIHVEARRFGPGRPAHGGSPLVDLASHDIALLTDALGSSRVIDAEVGERTYRVSLEFNPRRTATLHGSWDYPDVDRSMLVTIDGLQHHIVDQATPAPLADPLELELRAALLDDAGYHLADAAHVVRMVAVAERAARIEAAA